MDFRKWVQDTAELGCNSVTSGLGLAGSSVEYVTQWVGTLKLFGSTATSNCEQELDERHYFLVPDSRSMDGYSLVVTRCLPEGVPPINELPKRRVLHLPSPESEAMLRSLLVRQAQADELARPSAGKTLGDRAKEIADYIDILDDRVFGGVLLIGGLVAIFNPLAGAAIAAKSLIPSLGMFASKYGLRVAEESLNQAELKRRSKQAEKAVLNQFRGSQTSQQVNEILSITDRALRTTQDEFDPMLELHVLLQQEHTSEHRRMIQLASSAVVNVFEESIKTEHLAEMAGLGREDMRFLKLLKTLARTQQSLGRPSKTNLDDSNLELRDRPLP